MSTGPRTAAGKATSSQNATKHGLTSSTAVTKNESIEEFENFQAAMTEQYTPVGEREIYFVNEIIDNAWRLRRARRIETETFDRHCTGDLSEGEAFHVHAKEFDRVRRYVTSIERAMYKAIRELDQMQDARFDAQREEESSEVDVEQEFKSLLYRLAPDKSFPAEFVSQNSETAHLPVEEDTRQAA